VCPNTEGRGIVLAKYLLVYMNPQVNIMILCNNEMAIPAMQQLYMSGSLKTVVVPEKNKALFSMLKQMLTGTGVCLVSVKKNGIRKQYHICLANDFFLYHSAIFAELASRRLY
jgi:hypothetical protein